MKIFNLILAFFFLAFAALQFNDDPGDIWFWVFTYTGIAVICAFAAFGRYNMWVLLIGCGVVLYQMFRIGPAFLLWINDGMPSIYGEMKASSPHIELVREFFGLFLCFLVLVFHIIRYARLRKSLKEDMTANVF